MAQKKKKKKKKKNLKKFKSQQLVRIKSQYEFWIKYFGKILIK